MLDRIGWIGFIFYLVFYCLTGIAAEDGPLKVKIADPFIDIHSGPANAFPVFHVAERGDWIEILRRRTDWFEIMTAKGKRGWAHRSQMTRTLKPDGKVFTVTETNESDFDDRKWLLAVTGGEFEGAPVVSLTGAYLFTPNISSEFSWSQSTGSISSSTLYKANAVLLPLPDLNWSPFFTLGVGQINIQPGATLVTPNEKSNVFGQIGVGVQKYLSRRFVFRFEVSEYLIFSASNDDDSNEKISEWKTGFAVFFE